MLRWGFQLLLATGLVCLARFFWFEFEGAYFQASLGRAFDEQRHRSIEIAPEKGGTRGELPSDRNAPGQVMADVVGRLEIPSIGVKVMVLNGADASNLRRGAGWLSGTGRPGAGNAVIAAHRDTFFRPLRRIQEGDTIRLTTFDADYRFRVEWTAVVSPEDTAVLEPTREPALTLITCYPFYYVGQAPQRFIVRAGRQEQPEGGAGELTRRGNLRVGGN